MTVTSHSLARSGVHRSDEVDGVVVLTLDRPPANALSNALVRELAATFDALASSPYAPAVVLTGAGSRFFTAGGDIKEAIGYDAESMVERMMLFHGLLNALENYPRPLVCAVNGWCVGGGIEMTLFTDAVYAATDARFAFPEVNHGMLPAVKGIARARRVGGDRAARRLLLGGDPVDAMVAESLGLVDQVVAGDDLLATATANARAAAAKPPAVFKALKRALHDGADGWPPEKQLCMTLRDARTVFDDPAARLAREVWNG
jgi:enoyl-CoA hydratase